MRESEEAGESHRWIVFCQFHEEITMMSEFLKGLPFVGSVLQYHGAMNMRERDDTIEASKQETGKQDVFLIQLQAGGTGLNLQHYDRIVFISPWWTSALLEQAKGRAVRIGQKSVVKIYWLRLNAEDYEISIDNFMMDKADEKKDLGDLFNSWSYNQSQSKANLLHNQNGSPCHNNIK
jgi:SNF2 family DNA or RNA helicase